MGMIRYTALLSCVLFVAGCGQDLATRTPSETPIAATSTQGLEKGFKDVHRAIFGTLDRNQDQRIDEYEAGPHIPLKDFARMDAKGRGDGKITFTQFMAYGTQGGFFGGRDNQMKFLRRMRGFLDGAFRTFDANRDGYIDASELNADAWRSVALGFQYPNLRITLRLAQPDAEAWQAGDKTGDGRISAGEWEDLYLSLVVKGLASL